MKLNLLLVCALLSVSLSLKAQAEQPFAYQAQLQLDESKPFYELTLPLQVYQQTTRHDLGDIRVLNASGKPVPHGLRQVATQVKEQTVIEAVAFFPLYRSAQQDSGDLQLNIQRDQHGEVINISSQRDPAMKNEQLQGYLLDLRAWKHPLDELELNWAEQPQSFTRQLRVYSSDDLTHWKTLIEQKNLVNLNYQGQELVDNVIKLKLSDSRYIKLVFSDGKPGLEFERINASYVESTQEKSINWYWLKVQPLGQAGEYGFEHNIKSTLSQLRIRMPQNNTFARIKVFSRVSQDHNWRLRSTDSIYRLSLDGSELVKNTIKLGASRDRFWKLQIDQQGGGLGVELTDLEIGWNAQQLVFVARGQPPFSLVWGSAQVEPVTQRAASLFSGTGNAINKTSQDIEHLLARAQLIDSSISEVNLSALQPKAKPVNWKKFILWLVLIVAAALMIWMALRLMHKMSQQEG